jgi:hypothetical protein
MAPSDGAANVELFRTLGPKARRVALAFCTDPRPYKQLAPVLGMSHQMVKWYANYICQRRLGLRGGRLELTQLYWAERLRSAKL